MDYVGSMNNSLTYAVAVEKLMGIELNERVQAIRVITAELQRIASHLLAIGTYGLDIGAFTPFLHCFREREKVLDLFEWLCGARLLYNYNWIGGLSHDLPDTWTDRALVFLDQFEPVIDELDKLLSYNKIFTKRTADVGIIHRSLPSVTRSPGRTSEARASSGTFARKNPTAGTRSTSSIYQ